ncbi:hypothetical protein D3C75_772060 [compost metagenome]
MLAEFYRTVDAPVELGANILIPDIGPVLYISESGELFCYMGIVSKEGNSSGNSYSHVSLYGFYRHVDIMLSMGRNTLASKIFTHEMPNSEVLNQLHLIEDYFPIGIKVTREHIYSDTYIHRV